MGQPEPVTVHTLVAPTTIEARLATSLETKRQMFAGVFDGTSDELLFDQSSSALAALRDAYTDEIELGLTEAAEADSMSSDDEAVGDEGLDALDPGEDATEDAQWAPAGDAAAVAGRGVGVPPTKDAPSGNAALDVQQALSSLTIRPQPDGGLRIEAPPEAASALVTLFRGLADALEPR